MMAIPKMNMFNNIIPKCIVMVLGSSQAIPPSRLNDANITNMMRLVPSIAAMRAQRLRVRLSHVMAVGMDRMLMLQRSLGLSAAFLYQPEAQARAPFPRLRFGLLYAQATYE